MDAEILLSVLIMTPTWATLLPIGLCSVVLLAVVIERTYYFKVNNAVMNGVIRQAVIHLQSNRKKSALPLLKESNNAIVRVFLFLANAKPNDIVIDDAAHYAISRIERFSGLVSTIATITPMFGLLGTVTGMMKSFSALSATTVEAQNMLAMGIAEALVTTATGLLVAIPALIFYNYMVSRSSYLIKQLEISLNSIIETRQDGAK